jgi:hypothetical protein
MKTLTLLLLGSLIATIAGCAGAASSTAGAESTDVTGTWKGGTVTGTRAMTLQLQQKGTNVTGTAKGGGLDGPMHGTIGGNTIQFGQRGDLAPRLVVHGDRMYGELDGVPVELVRLGSPWTQR